MGSTDFATMIQDERYSGVLQGMGVNVKGIKNLVKLTKDESLSPEDVVDALSNVGNEDQVMKMGNIIKLKDKIAHESVVKALDDKETFHSLVKMGVDVNQVKKVAKLKEKLSVEETLEKVLDDDEAKGMFSNMGMDVNVLKKLSKIQEEVSNANDVNEVYEKPEYSQIMQNYGISPNKLKVFKNLQKELKNGKPLFQLLRDEESTLEEVGINLGSIKNFTKQVEPQAFEKFSSMFKDKDFSMFKDMDLSKFKDMDLSKFKDMDLSKFKDMDFSMFKNKDFSTFKGFEDLQDMMETSKDPKEKKKMGKMMEKMKKLMLKHPEKFGIKLPIEDCITETDDEGDCVSESACEAINGINGGPCHLGKDYASYPRVCCIHKVKCSGVFPFSKDVVYFTSPDDPSPTPCSLTLALNKDVCQVRLDFLDFSVGSLQSGQCSPESSFHISTNVKDSFIPVSNLCGTLSTKANTTEPAHLYLHIGKDADEWKYHNQRIVSLAAGPGVGNSKWNIKVTQIECNGAPLQAPSGCSQYYNDQSGSLVSLNYDDGQYMTNLDLTTCIKSQPACAIEYNLSPLNIGGDAALPGRVNYGLMCTDYLSFAGEKTGICGYSSGLRVTLPVSGYEGFTFRSNENYVAKESGFKLDYRFIKKCNNVNYFSYPVARSDP